MGFLAPWNLLTLLGLVALVVVILSLLAALLLCLSSGWSASRRQVI